MDAPEGEKKHPPEGGEKTTKRKMKTAYQLELLEQTYAMETYPSEAVRAELSVKLGLTDRQLQMWFCHRRLKDRKIPPVKRPRKDSARVQVAGPSDGAVCDVRTSFVSGHFPPGDCRKVVGRPPPVPVPRIGGEVPVMKRYYESPQSISELRAIAFVESQLGEPLREDGPILGVEFDPLPPDAFGAPLAAIPAPLKHGNTYDGKICGRQSSALLPNLEHSYLPSSSAIKRKHTVGSIHMVNPHGGVRALHEYQFLPEQPTVRSDPYEKVTTSHYYGTHIDVSGSRASSIPITGSFFHTSEHTSSMYSFQGQVPNVSSLSQQGRQGHGFTSVATEYESVQQKNFLNIGADAQFIPHPPIGLEASFASSDRQVMHEEEAYRLEKKRKSEEAKIQKEVEAHERRIRKELERQEALRRKREDQMRKEMERHDRERRKEEERVMRERQREEERFQREQKREIERREKFLLKENRKAEKIRQKEEQRREKEAARLRAANERATARRLARESMELIEDERLELMELAASSKGLPSIIFLEGETLQKLELFKDMRRAFPPRSVKIKKPFSVQPWADSEDNAGNLLMAWRFLITFTDVLDLWPFTLDEFVQALHDYDPRLLGEIHIALLRSVVKDIEDVVRTPSVGVGVNQSSAANPIGGHPQIVEGAYTWGFDIRIWQRHLNPSTWPEILRQFALSAGFGPKLKKRRIDPAYFCDDHEGHDGEDIISTLRNGSAVENAVALMQEKGYSYPRRSRHRLTPGTVKFAAFHVLSLEGSKGLTILEVADKIQKSGLRDLTTSKTPEASIAAALSRDVILFERTAPSTYCVRPQFRKDPVNAEAILAAARQRIQIFANRLSDSEEAEKEIESPDDVERDEDSGDEPEIDYIGLMAKLDEADMPLQNEKGRGRLYTSPLTATKESGNFTTSSQSLAALSHEVNNEDEAEDDAEIDESTTGEPWVQGLIEGEYSGLTVEERLNALVALINVAIEGNSIRVVLEERLEAANALKKQMWAEVQIDRRRIKDEYFMRMPYSSVSGAKLEASMSSIPVEGIGQNLMFNDNRGCETLIAPLIKQEATVDSLGAQNHLTGHEFPLVPDVQIQQHGYAAAEKYRSQLKSYVSHKAEEIYVYRSLPLGLDRRRNRYWQFATASRNDPGSGRIFLELQDGSWRLIDTEEAFDALISSLDTRGIRESQLHSMLQRIETSFKDVVRARNCHSSLCLMVDSVKAESSRTSDSTSTFESDSPGSTVCGLNFESLQKSVSFKIELGANEKEKTGALKRYQELQKWLWKECLNSSVLHAMKCTKERCCQLLEICHFCHDTYSSESCHCPSCHKTFDSWNINFDFAEHVIQCERKRTAESDYYNFEGLKYLSPIRNQILKAMLAVIEVYIPAEALQPYWEGFCRNTWATKLQSATSPDTIFQLLIQLECAVKRDFLSSNFETIHELVGSTFTLSQNGSPPGIVPVLPWVPQTTAAVALRLLEFDSSICYMLQPKTNLQMGDEYGDYSKLSSKYLLRNVQGLEVLDGPDYAEKQEGKWINMRRGYGGPGRGRGGGRRGRGRGGRGRSRRDDVGERTVHVRGRRGRIRGRGRGRGRGRRTFNSRWHRSVSKTRGKEQLMFGAVKQIPVEELPKNSGVGEWETKNEDMYIEGFDNDHSETYESDDNCQASGNYEYGYDEDADGDDDTDMVSGGYVAAYNEKREDKLSNGSEEDVDIGVEGDGDGDDDYRLEKLDYMDDDVESGGFENEESGDEDESTASLSSGYSE